MIETLVIGHRNPDTDAICSALGYAWVLQQGGMPEAVAACCGEINTRTQFALTTAGIEPPRLVMDVRPTIGRIMQREVITAAEDETLFDVYRRMQKHRLRALPVVDRRLGVHGIIYFNRLMELVLPDEDAGRDTRLVETSLNRMLGVLDGRFEHVVEPDREDPLIVMVAAMSAEGFTQRMHKFAPERSVIVAVDRPTVHLPALEYGVRCIIITGGYTLSPSLLQIARERGVSVISSPHDTASTTLLLRSAKLVRPAVTREFQHFSSAHLVDRTARDIAETEQDIFPVLDDKGALAGVFAKSDLVSPARTRLILVDHNEFTQAVTGADQAEILEVIDHHRVGGSLVSREPIRFINEPVGSTCTIITKFLKHRQWNPPRGIGLCLISGIISDTLHLTSPTTTKSDHEMLGWLTDRLKIDLPKYVENFFAAGSVLELHSPAEALGMDCKEYAENGWRFAVAQIEELGLERFHGRKESLEEALDRMVAKRGLDFAALMVTDITTHVSLLLVAGDEKIISAVDYPRRDDDLFYLEGVVSRKKQLLPHLIRIVSRLGK